MPPRVNLADSACAHLSNKTFLLKSSLLLIIDTITQMVTALLQLNNIASSTELNFSLWSTNGQKFGFQFNKSFEYWKHPCRCCINSSRNPLRFHFGLSGLETLFLCQSYTFSGRLHRLLLQRESNEPNDYKNGEGQ